MGTFLSLGMPTLDLQRVSARLRALQQVAGNPAHADMAHIAGCTEGAWKMYVKGERPIPPESVRELKGRWPISADWVYYGEAKYNDPAFQAKLDEAERNPIPMPRGRRPLGAPE
jgi:hypothetical protein